MFSTIKELYNGLHPVSGNREFGFTSNADGSYTFYTKGVDRLTDIWGTAAQSTTGFPFKSADALWESLKDGIVYYVKTHQGAATKNIDPEPLRPDWAVVKQVRDGIKPLSILSNDCK
ncbi:hypothetical protein [Pontibacter sp. SGAir0037]|uniref:hypothetical protein n=1 Tax=Pontibacter sp. SGAir0037 TaxID=2571030 RepID=UPI0010CCC502|nr:hypothetical protein [Pontibacter sp. SGAir0037]QCR23248.1 hypothetical protein C1N53_13465 [Pontibacter sp. SGAir0037]